MTLSVSRHVPRRATSIGALLLTALSAASVQAQGQDKTADHSATSRQQGGPPAPANPYESSSAFTGASKVSPEADLKSESEPIGASGTADSADDTDSGLADTGHVAPTSDQLDVGLGSEMAPFSVGGVTATLGKETWFRFYGFLQLRYVTGQYEDAPGSQVGGAGFSLARARMFFQGRLTDWLSMLIRVGANSSGQANFEQAFADFFWKDFSLRVGQFYLTTIQEQALSPVNLQGVDFSAVGAVFDGGQTQGLRLGWDLGQTEMFFSTTDGLRTGFSEVGSPSVSDIALTYRVQTVLGEGEVGRFNSGSSFRGENPGALLGAGVHYQSGGALREDAVQLGMANVDATFESNGVSAHTSVAVANTGADDGTRLIQAGVVAQGGYFLFEKTELFARYQALVAQNKVSSTAPITTSVFRGLTAGVTQWIFPARGIRAMADFSYYFDGLVGTPITPNPNAGLFDSYGPQWTTRLQMNVLF